MCGILSIISTDEKLLDEERFSRALEKSKHRGPDGSRVEKIGSHSLFGFNWLSIQDTRIEAIQPFRYGDNSLVFNGEIYNFLELRRDLEASGIEFHTKSDTEVLAAGLSHYGIGFLQKINGIFSFCFYDAGERQYLIVRDRFGVKPLFYYHDSGKLIVSSEIKSILEYVKPELDVSMLQTQFFLDPFVGHQKSRSSFKNVWSVEPGSYFIADEFGKILRHEYYYKSDFETVISDQGGNVVSGFENLLRTTLEWESRSDVPIGVVLSGGIDSTTLLTGAIPHLLEKQEKIPTFTYYFKERGEQTDLSYVKKLIGVLSKKYGDVFEQHELNFDAPFTIDDFMEAVRARESPVLDIRFVTALKMYQSIRTAKLKVALNGQGSDEIYYGYYALDYWMSVFYRSGSFDTQNVAGYFRKLNHIKFDGALAEFLDAAESTSLAYVQNVFDEIGGVENQQKLFTAFIRQNVLLALLASEDKFGMYSSVEVRVPLINQLLVDYADKLDYRTHLLSTTSGRHLFREILKDELPDDIVYREKYPGPKKKNYERELVKIIHENRDGILASRLVSSIYKKEFIKGIVDGTGMPHNDEEKFYGNLSDALVELIGLFCFEQVYGL